jgi:hypothetical protein
MFPKTGTHPAPSAGQAFRHHALIPHIVIALAAIEATRAQAAFLESSVRSRMGTGRCARASRSAPCPRARRGRRAALAFRKHNPRLRLRVGSKGRQFVVVLVSHASLLFVCSPKVVRAVGFEPTTSWFQARSAARLRYALRTCFRNWTIQQDSNLPPPGPQPGALLQLSYGWIRTTEDGGLRTDDQPATIVCRPSSVVRRLIWLPR